MSRSFTKVIAGLAMLGLAGPAIAQETGQAAAPQESEMKVNVSDADLQEFAEIQSDIRAIREGFKADQQAAETEAEIKTLQTDAQTELDAVIADSPLSVEELNEIALLIQQNQGVQQRYVAIIKQ